MTPTRFAPLGALLIALAALAVACGPRPTAPAPIQRGTALPPPGLDQAPRR